MKAGDKVTALLYGQEYEGTITRIGASGIVWVKSATTGIERFFYAESLKVKE